MSNRPILVILGASGFLGRNLVAELKVAIQKERIQVIRVTRNFDRDQSIQPDWIPWVDLSSLPEKLKSWKSSGHRVLIINCVALAHHGECTKNPKLAQGVNVDFVAEQAKLCRSISIPLVHISTDALHQKNAVYARLAPAYYKTDEEISTDSVYSQTKAKAEEALKELNWGYCVRLSFVGPGRGTGRGLIHFLADSITHQKSIIGYSDNWFTPLHTAQFSARFLALALSEEIYQKPEYRLLQWGTQRALTKFDFIYEVLKRSQLDAQQVKNVQRSAVDPHGAYVLDQSLYDENASDTEEMLNLSAASLVSELKRAPLYEY